MSRTVVSFEPLGSTTVFKLEDAPNEVPGLGENATADVTPLPGGDLIGQGTTLLARLSSHPPVKAGLDQALSLPATAQPSPLYFHVFAKAADELPWEQLYAAPHGFCALDRRWPVGRIARRRRPLNDRSFAPPLRIVAALSAARQTGTHQLAAILEALDRPDAVAIGVHVHVISGEQAVLDAVDAAIAAGRSNLTREVLAGTAPAVVQQILDGRPHLLHLLCHGGAVAGVRTLALATTADFDGDEETGGVRLKVADLVAGLARSDPWLVVLAACESAQAGEGTALAHDIVDNGVPAVIGMRRLVDLAATNQFCRALYPELLATVRAAVDPAGPPGVRVVDWASALTGPRTVLGGADPVALDAWTDPVLYAQEDPLRVFPPSPFLSPADFAGLRGQLDAWEHFLARLDAATADPGVLATAQAEIARLHMALAAAVPGPAPAVLPLGPSGGPPEGPP
jgi:hypothetical protein